MSNIHLIQSILEIVVVVGLIIALFHEPAIADWEERQKKKVLKALKERKRLRGE